MGRSLESRFHRYRRKGDVAALASVFDETAPEVLRVAMHLARDPAEAEDLLQRTFLSAIEAAASFDASKRLVPWLLGILGNHARESARKARRTVDPDRLRPGAVPDPATASESREAASEADRAIDALPDPYRSVLVLRYRHGMEPAEIANALGLPPATVRSHLHRGLERVKRSVPAGFASALFADLPVMRGLDSVRASVLARAGAAAAALAAVSAVATTALAVGGGALVAKKLVALAAVLLLFLGGGAMWWANSPRGDDVPAARPAAALAADAPPGLAAREKTVPIVTESTTSAASDALPTPQPGRAAVLVRVTWSDGTPAAGVTVQIFCWDEPLPWRDRRVVVTPADGVLRLDDLRPGRVTLYGDRGGSRRLELAAGDAQAAAIELRGATIEGTVVDEKGPVADAEIWIAKGWNELALAARTDPDGRFRLRDVAEMTLLAARAAGRPFTGRQYSPGKAGETATMRFVLSGSAAIVSGRVLDAVGRPIAGAQVLIGGERPTSSGNADGTMTTSPPPVLAGTNTEGAFRAEGLLAGTHPVSARAAGYGPTTTRVKVAEGEDARVDVRLERAATVEGTIRDEAGAPVARASVLVGGYGDFTFGMTYARADGTYVLEDLAPGAIAIRASSDNGKAKAEGTVQVPPGGAGRWDAVLGHGLRIVGRVLDERTAPLAGYAVEGAEEGASSSYRVQATTDTEGRFTLNNCRPVSHRLIVYPPPSAQTAVSPLTRTRGVRPGPNDVVLTVHDRDRPSTRVRGSVVGADGTAPAQAQVSLIDATRGRGQTAPVAASGTFELDPLPPGTYEVTVETPEYGRVGFGEREVAGTTTDIGSLVLRSPGTLVVEAVAGDGTPVERPLVVAVGEPGTRHLRAEKGVARDGLVPPGAYLLRVEGLRLGIVTERCVVAPGKETRVRVVLRPARMHPVVFVLPEDDRASQRVRARIYRDGDTDALLDSVLFRSGGALRVDAALSPGRYRAEATTDTELAGEAIFDVAEMPPNRAIEEIKVPLR